MELLSVAFPPLPFRVCGHCGDHPGHGLLWFFCEVHLFDILRDKELCKDRGILYLGRVWCRWSKTSDFLNLQSWVEVSRGFNLSRLTALRATARRSRSRRCHVGELDLTMAKSSSRRHVSGVHGNQKSDSCVPRALYYIYVHTYVVYSKAFQKSLYHSNHKSSMDPTSKGLGVYKSQPRCRPFPPISHDRLRVPVAELHRALLKEPTP